MTQRLIRVDYVYPDANEVVAWAIGQEDEADIVRVVAGRKLAAFIRDMKGEGYELTRYEFHKVERFEEIAR